MSVKLKSLLTDKNVLYVVMFVSVANFFVYLLAHNWSASIIFVLIAYLTTYFSKNMTVVLLSALVFTNMVVATRSVGRKIEGMKGETKDDKGKKVTSTEENDDIDEEFVPNIDDAENNESNINYAATLENAYDNLDNLIGKDGIDKMSQDTAKLVSQQTKLLKNLENMAPLLDNAGKLLNAMPIDGINKIQASLGGLMGNLKDISGPGK